MSRLESAATCPHAPRVLFLIEELELRVDLALREPGYFEKTYGRMGPLYTDGELSLFEASAILRHLCRASGGRLLPGDSIGRARADEWLDLFVRLGSMLVNGHGDAAAALSLVEEGVTGREWLLDDFSVADAGMSALIGFRPRLELEARPALAAYLDRIEARPAWSRAAARRAAAKASPSAPGITPEEVLAYWFGADPEGTASNMRKARRWFMGGPRVDREIRGRFGDAIEDALAGRLDHWAETPRGRLALVILVDQLTRNAFRNDPKTYAGDPKAQRLAIEAFDRGLDRELSLVERLFLSMPFLHAEDLALQARAGELSKAFAGEAPPELQAFVGAQGEQCRKYHEIISRFGRFPHRNAILGRTSTPDEEDFLRDWAQKAAPAAMRKQG